MRVTGYQESRHTVIGGVVSQDPHLHSVLIRERYDAAILGQIFLIDQLTLQLDENASRASYHQNITTRATSVMDCDTGAF